MRHKPKGKKPKAKTYEKPSERGLGPSGGAWNLKQASAWCGIGENHLRTMAKNGDIPCVFEIGRRMIVPREGFKEWFNTAWKIKPFTSIEVGEDE